MPASINDTNVHTKHHLIKSLIRALYGYLKSALGYKEQHLLYWWPYDEHWHKQHSSIDANASPSFEIAIGAILTQNTSWSNVEKAIARLKQTKLLLPKIMAKARLSELQNAIKPVGFYKQKAARIKTFASFWLRYSKKLQAMPVEKARELLLSIKGIGNETADSILLYAFNKPAFVIDAYTKRIMLRLFKRIAAKPNLYFAIVKDNNNKRDIKPLAKSKIANIFTHLAMQASRFSYGEWQSLFVNALPRSVKLYKCYHALLVEFAKTYCKAKPNCQACVIMQNFHSLTNGKNRKV